MIPDLVTDHQWPDALDALAAAPEHHVLLFENESVRVLDTRIAAGSRTAVHTHRWPGVLYILKWSAFIRRDSAGNVLVDSRTLPSLPKSSQSVWTAPLPPHSLENVGPSDLHVISVELKNPSAVPFAAAGRRASR